MAKISITLPSRGRVNQLKSTVNNILDTCYDINNIEILIKADTDDVNTIECLNTLPGPCKWLISDRGRGYLDLHVFTLELIQQLASGEFIMIMNDDAIIKTKNWDLEILKHSNEFVILNPKNNMNLVIFPIYPKKWVEILGHISESVHADTWIEFIAKDLGILKQLDTVEIFHDRADITGHNNDNTFKERTYTTNEIFTFGMQMKMNRDKHLIKEYIQSIKKK